MENVLNCCPSGEETVFSFLLEELVAQVNPLLAGHSVATQLAVIYILHVSLAFFWRWCLSELPNLLCSSEPKQQAL